VRTLGGWISDSWREERSRRSHGPVARDYRWALRSKFTVIKTV